MRTIADAANRRLENEHNGRVWHAWNSVALSRAKRLPRMQPLMIKRKSNKRQTWQEQMAICRRMGRGVKA
jgi:hypothetical protein